MSSEDDWQRKFICAARASFIKTSDIDKLSRDGLKENERAFSPTDVPRGRLRKYFNNLLNAPFAELRVEPHTQEDIFGRNISPNGHASNRFYWSRHTSVIPTRMIGMECYTHSRAHAL